jgi:serine protease
VRIKLAHELTDKIDFTLKSGKIRSSLPQVDEAMVLVGARSITRTFPYAGKYELRTRQEGLHLWYDIKYDTELVSLSEAIAGFSSLKEVEVTEPIRKIRLTGKPEKKTALEVPDMKPASLSSSALPFNDPLLDDQWHYFNDGTVKDGVAGADINLFGAWLKETGNPDVVVSVVDGGIDFEHQDLNANMWRNAGEYGGVPNVDDDKNGYVDDIYGYDFVSRNGKIVAHVHGTHVAGTIGAVNNNGIGVSGVAGGNGTQKGVRLMSCQVFSVDEAGEDVSAQSFGEAIKYGADNGAVISQNSWGYDEIDYLPESIKAAIDYFNKYAGVDENGNQSGPMKGGVVIFAAGNDSKDMSYPCSYEGVVAVASIAPDFTKAYYSNYGSWVDITAPGGSVPQGAKYSTYCQVLSTLPGNRYGFLQGTSMACPHVSGVAALIVSKFRGTGFTPVMLKERLFQGAVDINKYNTRYTGMLGVGLINTAASLSNSESIPPEAVGEVAWSAPSNNVSLRWLVTSDPDDVKAAGYIIYYSKELFNPDDVQVGISGLKSTFVEVGQLNVRDSIGKVIYDLEFNTPYYFSVAAYDNMRTFSEYSPLVYVTTGGNHAPIIETIEVPDQVIKAHETKVMRFAISDPDYHDFTWDYRDVSGYSTAGIAGGLIRVFISGPDAEPGVYEATLTATDEYGAASEFVIRYTILENHAPSALMALEDQYFGEVVANRMIRLNDYFTDVDGEKLSYSIVFNNKLLHAYINQESLYITTKLPGLSELTVVATDGLGETSTMTFKVMVRDDGELVDIYPNPVVDHMNIRMGESVTGNLSVEVYNSNGLKVTSEEVAISPFAPGRINLSQLKSGSYVVRIVYDEIDVKRNFVKL